jgi:hypothetical protein
VSAILESVEGLRIIVGVVSRNLTVVLVEDEIEDLGWVYNRQCFFK